MSHRLKQSWKEFKRSAPGRRFQDRFERHRTNPSARVWWRTMLVWGGGLLLLAIGTFLLVVPGPGMLFLFLGGAVLAVESRPLARFFDWSEMKVRNMVAWAKRLWKRMPIAVRMATVFVVVALGGGAVYASVRFFVDRA